MTLNSLQKHFSFYLPLVFSSEDQSFILLNLHALTTINGNYRMSTCKQEMLGKTMLMLHESYARKTRKQLLSSHLCSIMFIAISQLLSTHINGMPHIVVCIKSIPNAVYLNENCIINCRLVSVPCQILFTSINTIPSCVHHDASFPDWLNIEETFSPYVFASASWLLPAQIAP